MTDNNIDGKYDPDVLSNLISKILEWAEEDKQEIDNTIFYYEHEHDKLLDIEDQEALKEQREQSLIYQGKIEALDDLLKSLDQGMYFNFIENQKKYKQNEI